MCVGARQELEQSGVDRHAGIVTAQSVGEVECAPEGAGTDIGDPAKAVACSGRSVAVPTMTSSSPAIARIGTEPK